MPKMGYCSTCNKTFTLEDRVVGKVLTTGATAMITAFAHEDAREYPWLFAALNLGGLALGHAIDTKLGLRCRTHGCTTMLKILDVALAS